MSRNSLSWERGDAVKEPSEVLTEFVTEIPEEIEIRVSDSTAIVRYLVLPQRPVGTEDFTEEQLAALLTRDDDPGWLAKRHGVGVETERIVEMMALVLSAIASKVTELPKPSSEPGGF